MSREPKTLLVGPSVEDVKAEAGVSSLVRWNGESMYQAVEHCAGREIPVKHIYKSRDMTVALDH